MHKKAEKQDKLDGVTFFKLEDALNVHSVFGKVSLTHLV
jgi:hypothetical protein